MHYETFLFTRNQRQDFTAFIRPALMSNKDVSTIGGIFNYVNDISRLTPAFPSLYAFPLGEYVLLLRHYNSGRTHAGRAIGVIEGIAVKHDEAPMLGKSLASFVQQQADVLAVSASVADMDELQSETSTENDWDERPPRPSFEPFVGNFAERRADDRLFLPFTEHGRDLLVTVLSDQRVEAPLFFAFGTNADVLDQLERHGAIDIASYFNTERACFRSRTTNRVTDYIDGQPEPEPEIDPSMSLRPTATGEMRLRPVAVASEDIQDDEDTLVGSEAMSIRASRATAPRRHDEIVEEQTEDDSEATVLTMRQLRDKIRAEEAAAQTPTEPQSHLDPIHRLLRFFSSLFLPKSD